MQNQSSMCNQAYSQKRVQIVSRPFLEGALVLFEIESIEALSIVGFNHLGWVNNTVTFSFIFTCPQYPTSLKLEIMSVFLLLAFTRPSYHLDNNFVKQAHPTTCLHHLLVLSHTTTLPFPFSGRSAVPQTENEGSPHWPSANWKNSTAIGLPHFSHTYWQLLCLWKGQAWGGSSQGKSIASARKKHDLLVSLE